MQMPTKEDIRLVKEYVFLPLVLSVFERDIKLASGMFKTPGPIVAAMTCAMDRITAELVLTRRQMKQRDLRVYGEQVDKDGVMAEYKCRGYTGKAGFLPDTARIEVEMRMRAYLGEDMSKYEQAGVPVRPMHLYELNNRERPAPSLG